MPFETMLRQATVKAIDSIGRKASKTEKIAEGAIGKLLTRWNEMDDTEKEEVAAIVIATAATAVSAISAVKKRGVKASAKKIAKAGLKSIRNKAKKS
jgi:hypothetical protein